MNVIFAEDIGGWLLAGALIFGAIVATMLAIIGAFPAKKGNRFAAAVLAAPGIVVAVSSTLLFGYTAIIASHQSSGLKDASIFWLLTALPPLLVSGLVMSAAWYPSRK
jgi:hypothetical protein